MAKYEEEGKTNEIEHLSWGELVSSDESRVPLENGKATEK